MESARAIYIVKGKICSIRICDCSYSEYLHMKVKPFGKDPYCVIALKKK
jgi:hypothetical protein